jgi:Lsr2
MATRTAVALEDDLDGGPADETLRFGLDGSEYEIDLSKKNAKTFRNQLAPLVGHARKAGRTQHRRSARTSPHRERSGDIRAWAKDKGIPVSARGRIPASIVEQYDAANR